MSKQTHTFQAEVNEVLSIVVNSLYSHKEVFLRELISNASDALDRFSFAALTDHSLRQEGEELHIDIIPSEEAGTLTIRDNGIGMTEEEMISNLGTIAHSGSKKLMESLQEGGADDISLIGQFGVGFYSSYLVADRTTVVSRSISGKAHQWESEAKGEFTIEDSEKETRGTNVILHVKEKEREFLSEWRIKSLVTKFSDYVRYPIRLQVERERPLGDEKDEDGKPKKTEKVKEWEVVNSASALWTRPRSEIEDTQYDEFYKHLNHDWEAPLARTHFHVEGTHELVGLLFIPKHAPLDLFERKPRGLRLFVKRVFITDEAEDLLPEWLRFMRGIVDSEDLPLNVSREVLQKDRVTAMIRKQVTGHVLTLLEELAEEGKTKVKAEAKAETEDEAGKETEVDRYALFWTHFGKVLKEGVHHDHANRERIAALLRYAHSNDAEGGMISLQRYVDGMAEDQEHIYYLTAPSTEAARHSPHIEKLAARGYDVLLMGDPIDEWVVAAVSEFAGKKLVAAAKGSLDLPGNETEKKQREEQTSRYSVLLEGIKSRLGERIKEVRLTDRLTDSPACLVTDAQGLSPHIEQMLRAGGQDIPEQKRILELNPDHPVVSGLQQMAGDPERTEELAQWSELLMDQALVAEGSLPADPQRLAREITKLMEKVVGGE